MMIRDWRPGHLDRLHPLVRPLGVLGYYWSLRFVIGHRHRKARRLAQRYEKKQRLRHAGA